LIKTCLDVFEAVSLVEDKNELKMRSVIIEVMDICLLKEHGKRADVSGDSEDEDFSHQLDEVN
jgi:hypothetical protein